MNTNRAASQCKNAQLEISLVGNSRVKKIRRARMSAALFVCIAAIASGPIFAEDVKSAVTDEAVNCLPIAQIRQTKIIDDQNIVFTTSSNKFYNNRLPRKCSGLKRADKFRYKTSQSSLCNVDIITVLENAGAELIEGASCGLGSFTPTTDPNKKAKAG